MNKHLKMAHVINKTAGKRHVWIKAEIKDIEGKIRIIKIRKQIEKVPNDVPWGVDPRV